MKAHAATALLSVALALAACDAPAPAVVLPAFAAGLPGHTVAAFWSEPGLPEPTSLPAIEGLASAESWLGVTRARDAAGVQSWTGDPTAVAWRSLADNRLFAAACGAGLRGDRRLFVDLQQLIDLLVPAASAASTGSGPTGAMRGMVVQELVEALRLRSLLWLAAAERTAAERTAGERRQVQAVLAATDTREGVCGLPALPSRSALLMQLPTQLPSEGADMVLIGHFAPAAAERLARDLIGGDAGHGPLQMAREMLRGPRLESGLAAIKALSGGVAACGGLEFAHVWLGVADARALGDALDVLAQPATDGWQFGKWQIKLVAAGLVATFGRVPRAEQPQRSVPDGLWFAFPKVSVQGTLQRADAPNRLRLEVEMPVRFR